MTRLVFGDDVGPEVKALVGLPMEKDVVPLPVENETPSGTRKLAREILDDVRKARVPSDG